MLDAETKRRIDTARDILVGKVPDPKSQVEQITIALIYKFMDDMDAESEEWGGQRTFFSGEFAKYGWSKLIAPSVGGHEMLNLYAEAITRMPENPGIPPLFRDILRNAFLPYNDPETLRAFLKVINEFNYDHSERLGDAYEYLLSVLGTQGKLGQFRTPRHVIDFIVAVIDPKKDEVVLDPACGTAGFLISAYKRILAANTDHNGQSTLTPDDRQQLVNNFKGYDIDPGMVRFSLVNMYLHDFTFPQIEEYDTLTSDEKWNEYADVILANPPFMSPKGGIRPHNRFGVKSRRSEVLFVDYMAEHLTANGRAGIIVPEGVIFQSQNAHKQLRKMLVENYLVAVVSLPAGVFNPYSGVKTSILILDKSLAGRADSVAFFKVENDGFDLGAQRRPITQNDLPTVQAQLTRYLNALRTPKPAKASRTAAPTIGEPRATYTTDPPNQPLTVPKSKIANDGEYNLSGERYREIGIKHGRWPTAQLGELITLVRGVTYKKDDEVEVGGYQVLRANNINVHTSSLDLSEIKLVSPKAGFPEQKKLRRGDIFICLASGGKDHIGKVAYISSDSDYFFGGFMGAIRVKKGTLHTNYLYWLLKNQRFNNFLRNRIVGANINNLSAKLLYEYAIPIPPLEVQKEIVAEIDAYQKVINGAQTVIENYRPHIPINPDWPLVPLNEICIINPRKSELANLSPNTKVSFVPMADINENEMTFEPKKNRSLSEVSSSYTYFVDDDVLLARVTPCFENGKAGIARGLLNGIGFGSSEFIVIRCKEKTLPEWIYFNVMHPLFRNWAVRQMTGTGGLQRVPRASVAGFKFPLPPLETQQAIVAEIEAEQSLVNANRELIRRFQDKIQAAVSKVWSPTPSQPVVQ